LRFSLGVGRSRRLRCSPHRRDFGLAPSSCRLPLKGGVMREKQTVQKPRRHPANKPHPAIPAKAGIQYMKRAPRAPFKGGAVRQVLQCARTALYIALDSCFRRNGGYLPCHWEVFRAVLDFRSFYTAWKAGIPHRKRTLRAPLRCRGRKRKRDSGLRRNDEEGAGMTRRVRNDEEGRPSFAVF